MGSIDAVALAKQLVELRKARQSTKAVDQFVTEATEMEMPAILGSDTFKGRAKILKRWQKEDKDDWELHYEGPWEVVEPLVVRRKVKGKLFILTLSVEHKIHFDANGKIAKMTCRKI